VGFTGFTLVMPFLPLYFGLLGVTDVGEVALWSGLSLGVTPALAAILSPVWGRLADRFGLKLMVERSLLSFVIIMTATAFVTRAWHVFALRAVQGLFAGFGSLTLTMAAESAPRDGLESSIGSVQAAQRLGPTLGPVIGGTIANFDVAVYLDQSVGGTVKNLTIMGEVADGDDTGVYVYYGTTNTVNNVDIMDAYYGFYLYGSANNWITNNDITGSTYGLYGEYEVGDHIVNNYAEYDYAGFEEYYNGHQWYEGNIANGDVDGGSYGFYMYCDEYGLITMINNTATGNGSYGFYTYNCYDYYNSSPSNHSLFQGNVANDNDSIGFYDYYSINGVWMSNTAKRNGDEGFYMEYPGFVIFKWNIANRNGSDGIYAYNNYSSIYNFTTFANNKANYNDYYGINGDYGINGASGNIARHNGNAPDNCWNVDCN